MVRFFTFFKIVCARDRVIFQDAGKAHDYICDNGGDYEPMQTIGLYAFCVDRDGFITTDYVSSTDKWEINWSNLKN
jgi:hypothetical protein